MDKKPVKDSLAIIFEPFACITTAFVFELTLEKFMERLRVWIICGGMLFPTKEQAI
jgi:hypothetical protein